MHSWTWTRALKHIASEGGRGGAELRRAAANGTVEGTASRPAPERGHDLRTYGVGAQILRKCGAEMHLMGNPRRMPSMNGYGLEIVGYIGKHQAQPQPETV
jgi:3,4-dihydroxy 2-butanone 4-phosphate synthase/GTP cyclohydrolase II